MNKKQFMILALLTVASVIAAVLVLTAGKGRFSGGKVAFSGGGVPPFDVNAVTSISIENTRARLKIEKKNGMWIVPSRAGYPANFQLISDFVTTIRNVRVVRSLEPQKKYWRTYGVDLSSGNRETTTVSFFDSNRGVLASLIMGDMYFTPGTRASDQQPAGRYLLSNTKGALPFLAGVSFTDASPNPKMWLDKDFLKFQASSILSVKSIASSGKLNWEFRKVSGKEDFTLSNPPKGKAVSVNKIRKYIRGLSELSFDDVSLRKDGKFPGMTNFASVAIESGGAFYELKVGTEKGKYLMTVVKRSAPGQPESQSFFSKWVYEISPAMADSLNPGKDFFSIGQESGE
ncbi:MAG: hypothetical protein A2020_04125 [Lentisphaerae bacterium GWF2_45_14]|nr:MAG: hypothetical protein A2020_04125 [Lentisphaerae bacterium GWF2_45_14]